MTKKWSLLAIVAVIMTALTACGGEKEGKASSADSNVMEASIKDASFILTGKDDGVSEDQQKGVLLVDIKVKNKSKSPINLSVHRNIKLYDGDEQLNPVTDLYIRDVDLDMQPSSEIGAGKVKELTAAFEVEKDKKYEIGMQPLLADSAEETEEVKLMLDTKKYRDSYEKLQEPAEALAAYIDTIYLGKENSDYEKLISADKAALAEEAKEVFKDHIERYAFSVDITDADAEKYYQSYRSALNQKAEITPKAIANANDKAVVQLEYAALSMESLSDKLSDLKKEYNDNNEYDSEKSEQYAFSKFDSIINSLEADKAREPLKIKMMKKDGKWTVDTSDYNSEYLVNVFAKGSEY
ncbi:DUF5105 domain-containing protein [Bacillus xiapuensis]|uniref:DUF5105 domain-containing protein n=1 Tax=Bacillus xiapuensis TaxID=2014075 RepID=UPI000C239731|nr:DUF5105 domain-containing protein [Bacillus xiapuensis]